MGNVYQNEMAHEFRRQKYKRLRPYDQKRKEWRWSEIAERCRKKVSKMNSCQASKKGNARTCRKDAIQNNDEEERRTESEQNKKNKTQNQKTFETRRKTLFGVRTL